jgi:hypothetical protein
MAIEMTKPWLPLDRGQVARVTGATGVYELGDGEGNVLLIAFAGGRSRFGLRGELERYLDDPGAASRFRVEVNSQYLTRYEELLMAYASGQDGLPPMNVERATRPPRGRLR